MNKKLFAGLTRCRSAGTFGVKTLHLHLRLLLQQLMSGGSAARIRLSRPHSVSVRWN